jgi:CBS domain-containing protein
MTEEKIMVKCHEIMTENPVCCLADDKVEGIAQWMRTEDIGAVLVVDSYQTKKLIGIVTDRDIALRVIGARRDPTDTRVSDVMTRDVITCQPDNDLEAATRAMADHQIRRIPIVNRERQLLGIISQADLATRLTDLQKAADVLQEVSQPNKLPVRQ